MITAKRVDIRYATALLQTAKEQDLDRVVYQDMNELRFLLLNHTDFRNFLRSPAISSSQKGRILGRLFKDSLNKLTLDFLMLVLRKSRISNVQGIILAYVQLYRKEHHLKTITVYTAREISSKQKDALQKKLDKQFEDQTIEMRCIVRPEIIGGLVLRYDDYLYNNSVSVKLQKLRHEFEFNPHETQF